MVGGLVMAHGDDAGLRLPPRLAPIQVVVLAVRDGDGRGEVAELVVDDLRSRGVRVELDDRTASLRPSGDRLGAQGGAAPDRGRAAGPGGG